MADFDMFSDEQRKAMSEAALAGKLFDQGAVHGIALVHAAKWTPRAHVIVGMHEDGEFICREMGSSAGIAFCDDDAWFGDAVRRILADGEFDQQDAA